jgi:Ca-activated chloride channel family protein
LLLNEATEGINMSTVTERLPLIQLPIGQHQRGVGVIEVAVGTEKKLLPLASVDIEAKVADRVASVTVKQKFRNTFKEHLEAVYIFPLSGGCVVSDFELRVGGRVVKGLVKERAAARQQYQQALQEGKRAALLEQERDDVFTMQVGNLPPGEEITVALTYSERLPYFEAGTTELRLPTVVGERYIAGTEQPRTPVGDGIHLDTDAVPDASRITPPLLAPGFDPMVDLKIAVDLIEADGIHIDNLTCSQHATKLGIKNGVSRIELAKDNERLNRDFVLRWNLAGKQLRSNLLVFHADDGDYAMLSVIPPKQEGYVGVARDVVFLIDRSGSMMGVKMVSAVRACSVLLQTLGPQDRFAICAFDNIPEWMGARNNPCPSVAQCFVQADEAGIEAGLQHLRTIQARGGTELYNALGVVLQTLSQASNQQGRVPVVVVLTDGEVGDEGRILKRVQQELKAARLFAVGIDTAVNSGLLRRMANLGGGTASFVQPGSVLESALQAVGREIGNPLVTDLTVESINGTTVDAASVTPERIPDLFAGRASTAFFKLSGKGAVHIKGKFSDGKPFDEKVKQRSVEMPAIAQLWAKARIVDLEDNFRVAPSDALKTQIIDLSVKHQLLTKFTAFVAVDESEIVNKGGTVRTVVQPVERADAWQMYDQAMLAGAPQAAAWGAPPAPAQAPPAAPQAAPAAQAFAQNQALNGSLGRAFSESAGADAMDMGQSARGKMRQRAAAGAPQPAPPPQQPQSPSGWSAPAMPSMGGAGGSMLNQAKELLGGGAAGARREAAKERQSIEAALKQFAEQLEQALKQLKASTLPSAEPIKNAWQALLDTLSQASLGTEVPELQKFLRSAAVELIDSLRQPGVDAAGLLPLWERHLQAFEQARDAATKQLAGAAGGEDKFWELTV